MGGLTANLLEGFTFFLQKKSSSFVLRMSTLFALRIVIPKDELSTTLAGSRLSLRMKHRRLTCGKAVEIKSSGRLPGVLARTVAS